MKKALVVLILILTLLMCFVACDAINCKHDDPMQIVEVDAVAPTCQKTGLSSGMKCIACGTMVVPQAIIPTINCIEYTLLSNNTYEVSGFVECSETEIAIPSEYNGLPVTSISEFVFRHCRSLTSVVIPDSVTSIGDYAFYNCSSLTSVVIGDSVASIGYGAFENCSSLTSVVIGDSVTSIGYGAFQHCSSLSSVVIPNSVTSIGDDAFDYCFSLTSVVIGDSVTSIGYGAFENCSSLTSVVIPNSVTSIGDHAFWYCHSLTSVVIPDSVTSIGDRAFDDCHNLKDVYYTGSEEEWKAISIGTNNDPLTGATIHYNYVPEN